jgi:hypothetical protein
MMDFFKKNAVLLGIIGAIFIGLVIYLNFFANTPSAELLTATQPSPVSQELLATLSNLHTIKLDNSIFSDPAFLSLTNFGVELPPEAVGRRNPFLPIGQN